MMYLICLTRSLSIPISDQLDVSAVISLISSSGLGLCVRIIAVLMLFVMTQNILCQNQCSVLLPIKLWTRKLNSLC